MLIHRRKKIGSFEAEAEAYWLEKNRIKIEAARFKRAVEPS